LGVLQQPSDSGFGELKKRDAAGNRDMIGGKGITATYCVPARFRVSGGARCSGAADAVDNSAFGPAPA
jgi:hypothetical protein